MFNVLINAGLSTEAIDAYVTRTLQAQPVLTCARSARSSAARFRHACRAHTVPTVLTHHHRARMYAQTLWVNGSRHTQ